MSDKNYYHDEGEKDASNDEYNPPHGILTLWTSEKVAENEAYDKGYSHAKGQIDGSKNDYNSGYSGDDSYNKGWDSGYDNSGSSSSGGCFITTATLTSIGKPDNCNELKVFRNFRDNWLAKQSDGQKLISEYYTIAPQIVKAINLQDDFNKIYNNLWKDSIEPCFKLIKDSSFEEAKKIYCKVVEELNKKFLDK